MDIVGIIPARGGSKTIKNKNMIDVAGKPLIHWTIKAAIESDISKVFVSSDCEKILEYAQKLGVQTIERPSQMAQDQSSAFEVLNHAVNCIHANVDGLHAMAYLQPTSPLRSSKHINEAINLYRKRKFGSVISVCQTPHNHTPNSLMTLKNNEIEHYKEVAEFRRQEKAIFYSRNGPAIVVVSCNDLQEQKTLYAKPMQPLIMKAIDSIDIDDHDDLELVRIIMNAKNQ